MVLRVCNLLRSAEQHDRIKCPLADLGRLEMAKKMYSPEAPKRPGVLPRYSPLQREATAFERARLAGTRLRALMLLATVPMAHPRRNRAWRGVLVPMVRKLGACQMQARDQALVRS
jgi:hypothetical protein